MLSAACGFECSMWRAQACMARPVRPVFSQSGVGREAAAMLMWISVVGVLARIQLLRVISRWYVSCDDQQRALWDLEATTFCEQEPAGAWHRHRFWLSVGISSSSSGISRSSSNADVDFSRWCIRAYPTVASDQLLRVAKLRRLVKLERQRFEWSALYQLLGFPGFATSRGYDPAGGAPGGG
ncbi:hypothetical protein F511_37218 [Dorcoceras hygrometricum]|uniref:Uncharacterized protein n=1 Tax=Dorcoceras hygrometricum TaxID=472368 RepID=A0A2Z7BYF9_9LAMI|nr:hypothetical protein F511_37218 [Dorcoceras hygrometricum]